MRAALESIPVSIAHSGADYLLPEFGGPQCPRKAPYNFKKSYGGGFVWGLSIVSTL
jgi:hypothetical protein